MSLIIQHENLGNYHVPESSRNGTCVDVGANVGSFTNKYKNFFSTIHCYEPIEECFEIIEKKFKDNQNVKIFREAAYHSDEKVVNLLMHKERLCGSTAIQSDCLNNEWSEENKVGSASSVSLETILKRIGGHINYMKIDCETSEYHLLMNKDLRNIDNIGIEVHWQMGSEKFSQLINHIKLTHSTSSNENWQELSNKEMFFTRKI